ncbi:preprotein translocase subunit SecE [Candidatus Fermentibacteria bacterium]|nr:preprotein translocase subunit SecE [Candidatus Fermentibacteria bacterium]
MTKVAWPTREEIVASTWVVITGVFFVAVWIFLSDSVSQTVITTLVGILR